MTLRSGMGVGVFAAVAVVASLASAQAPAGAEHTCHALNAAQVIDLTLTWKSVNSASGQLVVDGRSSPVVAELYKGLILIDAPGTTNLTGKIATVTTDGAKTIRLGDYKQPTFDCK